MGTYSPLRLAGIAVICFVLAGYVLNPLVATISSSLQEGGAFSLSRYLELFDPHNTSNLEAVWNSVLVSLLSVVLGGAVGTLMAFVFTQLDFPLRRVLSRLAVVPIALPPLVGVIAFLFVFGESGILPRLAQRVLGAREVPFALDGVPAVVVVHVYSFYVYFYLLASTALRQIDANLLEAAAGLGSGSWRLLRHVVFPELRPALLGASVLTFMASMSSFSAPLIFAGAHRFITLEIYTTKLNGEMGLAAAQSILLLLVAVGFFIASYFTAAGPAGARAGKGAVRAGRIRVDGAAKSVLILLTMGLIVLEFLPIATIVMLSFVRDGSWTSQVVPDAFTLDNYLHLLQDPEVALPIRNSAVMSLLTLAATLAVGVSCAYAITKGMLRRRRLLFDVLLTMPYAIPGTVAAISMILAFNRPSVFTAGTVLIGTFWILPAAYFVRTYPLVLRSTSASLDRVDDALLEAGRSLGAGPWRNFTRILLPLVLPGIVSGGMLVVMTSLGEFVSSILLYTYSSRPISIEILSQLRMFNFGSAAAYSVVLLGLILAVVFLSQRIGGVSRGRAHAGQAGEMMPF